MKSKIIAVAAVVLVLSGFHEITNAQDKKPAPAEGIIAIQVHAGFPKMRVEYRDIEFTDLSKR